MIAKSQETITIKGVVSSANSSKVMSGVHVKVNQQNIISRTSTAGEYSLNLKKNKRIVLVFSHVGYQTIYEPINLDKDTVYLNVVLNEKVENIPVFEVGGERKPVVVFKSGKINVADYEFYEDKYLFLVYGKKMNKDSEIYLVDKNEQIISKHFVPGVPVELYSDYMGNINLICKKAIYRIEVQNNKVNIYELPMEHFNSLIKPIVDTLEGRYIFSDFLKQFPKFKYYAFNSEDTSISVIREMQHKDMAWKYMWEYEYLNNADRQFAKRMAARLKGYDKYDVAAAMTGFANDFMYETVYAPLFIVNDTINIFDHSESKIWKYIKDTVEVGAIDISYHKPKKKNSWKRKLIMDEVTGVIYGVFLKNGYYYLKEINTSNGKILSERKLTYQYVSKLKIKDGFIYYTYKPSQSLLKKYLYKEHY
ncbi:MAG: carboxypeptidase-like regulatory domain-containing protein [Vicingaceae bacterium]